MIEKFNRNEIIWLILGGVILGGIEALKAIPDSYSELRTACEVCLIYIATGIGVYRTPN